MNMRKQILTGDMGLVCLMCRPYGALPWCGADDLAEDRYNKRGAVVVLRCGPL
jgi:hypothetical protein